MQETQVSRIQSHGQEDALEEETATRSSILVWEIPQTDGLHGFQRARHDRATEHTGVGLAKFLPLTLGVLSSHWELLTGFPHQSYFMVSQGLLEGSECPTPLFILQGTGMFGCGDMGSFPLLLCSSDS